MAKDLSPSAVATLRPLLLLITISSPFDVTVPAFACAVIANASSDAVAINIFIFVSGGGAHYYFVIIARI
jgi:hypothetical protein